MTARTRLCPTCRSRVTKDPGQADPRFPFCSERCQLADLGRWFSEEYRIAGTPTLESAEAVVAAQRGDDD